MDFQQQTEEKLQRLVDANRLTPVKAIRIKCLDCMGFQPSEVLKCPCNGNESSLCSLYKYRMGKRARHKPKESTPTQLPAL